MNPNLKIIKGLRITIIKITVACGIIDFETLKVL